jgi:hypothetical protein
MPCGAGVCTHHAGLAGREANRGRTTQSLGRALNGTCPSLLPAPDLVVVLA